MISHLLLIAASIAYALAVVVYARPLAERLGVMDMPGKQAHKAHRMPTPLVGGIACMPPAIATLALALAFGGITPDKVNAMWAMACVTLASFVIGLLDDREHIAAWKRLLICGAVFLVALALSPEFIVDVLNFQSFGVRAELGIFAIPFTVLCLLAFQNAVNMADGRNGLVCGMTIIWLLTLLSYGAHPSNYAVIALLAALVVVMIANLKGRLFLGDAGTYGIGAFVGLVIVWLHRSNIGLFTADVATILSVPVLDMIRLFGTRIIKGKHPFSADHDHLHHLLDDTWGWNTGRWIYFAMVALPIVLLRLAPNLGVLAAGLSGTLYALVVFALHRVRRARTRIVLSHEA